MGCETPSALPFDLFDKAANCFKLAKSWDRAGAVYVKLASCHLKLDSKHEAASAYANVAYCYKKTNMREAISCLEQAVHMFLDIGRLNMSARYYKEIGELYEQEENLKQAIIYYEKATIFSEGHLLNAGICQLCKGDVVAINNALERYQELDPTFSGTRECKLLVDLEAAIDEEDVAKFTGCLKEYDSMTKLDEWRTTLLLRVKEALKAKELEEDDLT
ncbi:hypothetical protein HAX54_036922 [Datura stramonium]|uniref:Alpha-soluble NSF attachment protein n=1 Tax=Datura stramonium TaxID=4076 RepID=A0ABS8VKT0_DATST|nr:hypothetical protein [Datura stramonium]